MYYANKTINKSFNSLNKPISWIDPQAGARLLSGKLASDKFVIIDRTEAKMG